MTPTLTALLCLGTLHKPTLWAEPGSVVARGRPVTIWCEGSLEAQEYYLHKEGHSQPSRESPLEPENKAKFSIPTMTEHHAGKYQCLYLSPAGWSERSDPLELVVTGSYSKPWLSALPSPVVTSGGNVTLQCGSGQRYDRFVLTKEGGHHLTWTLDSQRHPSGQFQALFPVGPVTPSHRWTFTCYGYFRSHPQVWSGPSDPLELLVSECSQGPRLCGVSGGRETGRGREDRDRGTQGQEESETMRQTESTGSSERGPGEVSAQNKLGPPSPSFLSLGQLPVTPSLSVQPGPTVSSGENMTLLCQSYWMDTFLLCKEGAADPPLRLRAEYRAPWYQAEFSMRAVTPALGGTYRCYGSHSSSPYLLSQPSAPLDLVVSGERPDPILCELKDSPRALPRTALGGMGGRGLGRHLPVLVGVSVAFLLLLPLLLVLLVWRHSRRRKAGEWHWVTWLSAGGGLPMGQARVGSGQTDRRTLRWVLSSPGPGFAGPSTHPPSHHLPLQDAASEGPQDVTYAQLCRWTLRRGAAAPPSSQVEQPPAEPSVYAALAPAHPGAAPKDTH
uniref:Ig-like domain-containing protein n=1 Tax=Spermophilus dauricus TaxID=99837 RepID=A0A8C9PHH3_SPEDA